MVNSELATVEDTFGDALHDRLDAEVNRDENVSWLDEDDTLLKSVSSNGCLLRAIINHSDDRLNGVYSRCAGRLVRENPLLQKKLQEAWGIRKYRTIRLLEILQLPDQKPFSASFHAPFCGAAVDGLYEYLKTSERLFQEAHFTRRYYAKFISIIQSAGTGKSRILTELSKKNVVVLYINLRNTNDGTCFPARDPIPLKILTRYVGSAYEYEDVCFAFFAAVFKTLEQYLSDGVATRGADNVVKDWSEKMCDMDPSKTEVRKEFFRKVEDNYDELYARILNYHKPQGHYDGPNPRLILCAAYGRLGACLEKIISGDPNLPKLVVAIDEAQTLSGHCLPPGRGEENRPVHILTRAINDYTHSENQRGTWIVFASTSSRVADSPLPNVEAKYNASRFFGVQLFHPYTQVGWDQHVMLLGDVAAEDISKVYHIIRYGRPLWKSLGQVSANPKELLNTASSKLCGVSVFDPANIGQVLAVVGQRFGLEVKLGHPASVEILETAISNHLRICLGITADRSRTYTSYPSEPFLSCAAASLLHSDASNMHRALETLEIGITMGMINVGEPSELVGRLLWLLAKDLYVRERFQHSPEGLVIEDEKTNDDPWHAELLDCKMIPVIDWLEFVFGERGLGESDKDRENTRKCFEGAYTNFSHWMSMDSNLPGAGDELPLGEWTLRRWQRTSAVQCYPQQTRVDKMIPIYFKDAKNPVAAPNRMSQIFIFDSDRRSSSKSNSTLNSIATSLGRHPTHKDKENTRDNLPHIVIRVNLGLSSDFSVASPDPSLDVTQLCLRIHAAGIDATIYPFLAQHPHVLTRLQNLVSLERMMEDQQRYRACLKAQAKFGKTATAAHMGWEGWNSTTLPGQLEH